MPMPPTEPPASTWSLPDPHGAPAATGDLVGIGADLEPGTILAAYRRGLFPMPLPTHLEENPELEGAQPIGWWSPELRGVLPLDNLRVSRSLRKSCAHFEIRVDTSFQRVIEACADPSRKFGWIDESVVGAYLQLHELGWAHSVETWNVETAELAGGLYGLAIGAFFAGESMFHFETDASKVALVGLVKLLRAGNYQLLDVQWKTEHLESLGVIEMPRIEYLRRLELAVERSAEFLGPLTNAIHF